MEQMLPNNTFQPSAGSEFLTFHQCCCPRRLNAIARHLLVEKL